jgi:electron transfer flavoprotein alpha subunit
MAQETSPGKQSLVLAFVDLPGGELDDCGKGLLSEGARLAGALGGRWGALSFGDAADRVFADFAPYGVPAVTVIESTADVADCLEIQGRLLAAAVRDLGAGILLLPHNDLGSALAPLVAAELRAGIFTEAVAFEACDKGLKVRRPALGHQVSEARIWDGSVPLVLTMHVRVMSATVLPAMRRTEPQVNRWRPTALPGAGPTRIVERIPPDPQTVDVAEAEVIFSAGLGCNRQSFEQLQELTRLLNVSLGATRPVYDLGWTGFERMVGQTGRTVAPRLYLALGISGSMHHLGGIKDAKKIVAVNSDPKVPIFPNADEGFVADLRQVLPLLLQRVKLAIGGAA